MTHTLLQNLKPPHQDADQTPLTEREWFRVDTIDRLGLRDNLHDPFFERIIWMLARMCDVDFATFSILDEDTQWIQAGFGVDPARTDRTHAFCHYTVQRNEPLIVSDLKHDPRFAQNPFVLGAPYFASYAGHPIKARNGARVGTVCIIDSEVRQFDDIHLKALDHAARAIEEYIHQQERLATPRPEGYSQASESTTKTCCPCMGASHHRIRNLFASIQSTCGTLLDQTHPEETHDALRDIQHAVETAYDLLESVFRPEEPASSLDLSSPE